jgi:hypothetical protein
MMPLMKSPSPGVDKARARQARRVSSVDSTPIALKRLAIVGPLSSAARMPLPSAANACTVAESSLR